MSQMTTFDTDLPRSSAGPGGPQKLTLRAVMTFASRNRMLVVGTVMITLIAFMGICAPWLTPYDPEAISSADILHEPGTPGHLLGTDQYGRDVLTRMMYAARIDLALGFLGVLFPFTVGLILGGLAGYFGGWVDSLVMRIVDSVAAFPYIIILVAIVAVLGPGLRNLFIALTLAGWTPYTRLLRGEILVVRETEFMEATRSLGYSNARVIIRHLLPNVVTSALVFGFADVVLTILGAASLSYLGLGIQPPTPEWGSMISEGQIYLMTSWWLVTLPGLACVVTGLALSFIGDGLAELLRPSTV